MSNISQKSDPLWRWKIDRPTPDVEKRTIENLLLAGYVRSKAGLFSDPKKWDEWRHPEGGPYFPVLKEDGKEYISHHAITSYGHWLDPCSICGVPVDATAYSKSRSSCFTCYHWLSIAEKRDEFIIVDSSGQRTSYQDCGWSSGPKPCNGFGGHVFYIEALDGSRQWKTNNLFTQGVIPERFYELLPPSHRFVDGSGNK